MRGKAVATKMVERIGVIGDIHAEDAHLKEALTVLEDRGLELVLATGDIADGAGSLDLCCELLAARDVSAVSGNHDRWLLTRRSAPRRERDPGSGRSGSSAPGCGSRGHHSSSTVALPHGVHGP